MDDEFICKKNYIYNDKIETSKAASLLIFFSQSITPASAMAWNLISPGSNDFYSEKSQ